jgi:hypothetical protein
MDLVKLKQETDEKIDKQPTVADIKKKKKTEQLSKEDNTFEKRKKELPLEYILDDGSIKKTKLISKVMDSKARLEYERVLSALSDGVYFDRLPYETKNRHLCIARIVCQLDTPPSWVLEAAGEDLEFCFELGGRLLQHEGAFFRNNNTESDEHESKPRFRFSEK